jgi:type II secretory pathway component HofQ
MKDTSLGLANTRRLAAPEKERNKINQAYPLGASAMKLTPLFSSLNSVLKVALKESGLSKQRGGYIVAVSPENPEKERRKQRKLKTSFLIG